MLAPLGVPNRPPLLPLLPKTLLLVLVLPAPVLWAAEISDTRAAADDSNAEMMVLLVYLGIWGEVKGVGGGVSK